MHPLVRPSLEKHSSTFLFASDEMFLVCNTATVYTPPPPLFVKCFLQYEENVRPFLSLAGPARILFTKPVSKTSKLSQNLLWCENLDSRFRGNDAPAPPSVMPALRPGSGQAPAGIQG